ncbi:hypothetical protein ACEPAG_8450 [Sanghuangporus baumii]
MAHISPPTSVPAPAHFVNENRAPRDDDGSRSRFARPEPAFQAHKPMTEYPNPYGRPLTNVVGTDVSNGPRGSLPWATASDRMSQPPPYTPFVHVARYNVQPQPRAGMPHPIRADGPRLDKRQIGTANGRGSEDVDLESMDSVKRLLAAVLCAAVARHYVAIDLGIYKNRRAQPVTPQRAYLPTSAGLIAYNPITANAGAMMGNSAGTGSTQFASTGNASMISAGLAQQPMAQYYPTSAPYKQGLGNAVQAQTSNPQAVTGTQPAAVAPMVPATTGGGQGTTMGMSGALAGGTGTGLGAANGTAVSAAAQEGAAEAAGEEAEAEAGIGTCWNCCGTAAAPGGSAEMAAGGPVGPDAAVATGPSGPAGPTGERIVQYFKSGYNSAAMGANANNNLPVAIATPSSRGAVPPV